MCWKLKIELWKSTTIRFLFCAAKPKKELSEFIFHNPFCDRIQKRKERFHFPKSVLCSVSAKRIAEIASQYPISRFCEGNWKSNCERNNPFFVLCWKLKIELWKSTTICFLFCAAKPKNEMSKLFSTIRFAIESKNGKRSSTFHNPFCVRFAQNE